MATLSQFGKQQMIFRQGQSCPGVYVVASGMVEVENCDTPQPTDSDPYSQEGQDYINDCCTDLTTGSDGLAGEDQTPFRIGT